MKTFACLALAAFACTELCGGVAYAESTNREVDDTIDTENGTPAAATSSIICDGNLDCENIDKPVCTSLGRTYSNECQFKNAYCESPSPSFFIVPCPAEGETFRVLSVNDLREEEGGVPAHILNVPITLNEINDEHPFAPVSIEECDGVLTCPPNSDPVCTSYGTTYRNRCEFKNAYCESPNDAFYIMSEGPCDVMRVQSADDESSTVGSVSDDVLNVPVDVDDFERPTLNDAPSSAPVSSNEVDDTSASESSPPADEGEGFESPILEDSDSVVGPTLTWVDCDDGDLSCESESDPVCTSYGQTFRNKCEFKNAYCESRASDFYIVSKGPCGDDAPLQVQSISDEEQQIWARVLNVEIELDEVATPDPAYPLPSESDCDGQLDCDTKDEPVCTSYGRSYSSFCQFKNAYCEKPDSGFFVVSSGRCKDNRNRIEVQDTIDAVTNEVLNVPVELDEGPVGADSMAEGVAPVRRQKTSPYCTLECPGVNVLLAPICGTDSTTYINDCHLLSTKCEQPDLEKQYDGLCVVGFRGNAKSSLSTQESSSRPKCNSRCAKTYAPVCGSNGVTYANECLLEYASCQNALVTKLGDGKCSELYGSNFAASAGRKNGAACVPSVCPGTEAPVCGSDGQTYLNVCMLKNAQCQIPDLVAVHDGECDADTVLTCKTLTCPRYTECREEPGTQAAYCVDVCHKDRCGPNETCQLLDGECFTAPCSPVATCVRNGQADQAQY